MIKLLLWSTWFVVITIHILFNYLYTNTVFIYIYKYSIYIYTYTVYNIYVYTYTIYIYRYIPFYTPHHIHSYPIICPYLSHTRRITSTQPPRSDNFTPRRSAFQVIETSSKVTGKKTLEISRSRKSHWWLGRISSLKGFSIVCPHWKDFR